MFAYRTKTANINPILTKESTYFIWNIYPLSHILQAGYSQTAFSTNLLGMNPNPDNPKNLFVFKLITI